MIKTQELRQDAETPLALAGMATVGQMVGMQALLAEMQALTAAMPGLLQTDGLDHRSEAEVQRIEASIEAGFDNMPV